MLDSIVSLSLLPFSFVPVQVCCGFAFILSLFGLVRRILIKDFSFRSK